MYVVYLSCLPSFQVISYSWLPRPTPKFLSPTTILEGNHNLRLFWTKHAEYVRVDKADPFSTLCRGTFLDRRRQICPAIRGWCDALNPAHQNICLKSSILTKGTTAQRSCCQDVSLTSRPPLNDILSDFPLSVVVSSQPHGRRSWGTNLSKRAPPAGALTTRPEEHEEMKSDDGWMNPRRDLPPQLYRPLPSFFTLLVISTLAALNTEKQINIRIKMNYVVLIVLNLTLGPHFMCHHTSGISECAIHKPLCCK